MINITKARNNLSSLIDRVVEKKERFLLLRNSKPQAVIISYPEYKAEEEKWEGEVRRLMDRGKEKFKEWLLKEGREMPESEEEVSQLVEEIKSSS